MIYLTSGSRIKTNLKFNTELSLVKLFNIGYRGINDVKNYSDESGIPSIILLSSLLILERENDCYEYLLTENDFIKCEPLNKNPEHLENIFEVLPHEVTSSSDLYNHYLSKGGFKSMNSFIKTLKEITSLITPTRMMINGSQVRAYRNVRIKK